MAFSYCRMRYALWFLVGLLACCCLPLVSAARAQGTALQVATNLGGTLAGLARVGDMALLAEGASVPA